MSTQAEEEPDWTFIDNGEIRLGVNPAAGAAIGWFSLSGSDHNLLNHYDSGRYIQQSWYGDEDGSDWNGQSWCWNPVQGGGFKGQPARLNKFTPTDTTLSARITPAHWATGELLEDVEFTQAVLLKGKIATLMYRMIHKGEKTHKARHQELPAVFVDAQYSTLAFRSPVDGSLQRIQPGWPNEYHSITGGRASWVAWVNDDDYGIGIMAPGITQITCYRYTENPLSACSYVAPIRNKSVRDDFWYAYEAYLTIGSLNEIETRFVDFWKSVEEKGSN